MPLMKLDSSRSGSPAPRMVGTRRISSPSIAVISRRLGRMEPAHVTFTASAPGRHTGLVRCCVFGRSGHLTLRLPAS